MQGPVCPLNWRTVFICFFTLYLTLTGNRMGWTARCGRPPLLLPSCMKLEFRLSALMDSDLAWVNGKSGRQSWRYHADAFQRSIISEAIYHLFYLICVSFRSIKRFKKQCRTKLYKNKNIKEAAHKSWNIVRFSQFVAKFSSYFLSGESNNITCRICLDV